MKYIKVKSAVFSLFSPPAYYSNEVTVQVVILTSTRLSRMTDRADGKISETKHNLKIRGLYEHEEVEQRYRGRSSCIHLFHCSLIENSAATLGIN